MEMKIIQTAKNTGERFTEKEAMQAAVNAAVELKLQPEKKYQSFIGFGGAFTEAAAYTLAKIPEEDRERVIEGYFNPEQGIGSSLG